jgi:hypothetical protein
VQHGELFTARGASVSVSVIEHFQHNLSAVTGHGHGERTRAGLERWGLETGFIGGLYGLPGFGIVLCGLHKRSDLHKHVARTVVALDFALEEHVIAGFDGGLGLLTGRLIAFGWSRLIGRQLGDDVGAGCRI